MKKNMRKIFVFLLTCGLISMVSCASSPSPLPPQEVLSPKMAPNIPLKEIESSRQVKAMNEKIMMRTLTFRQNLNRDYRIGPEDLLEISILEDEKLNKTVRVSTQGNISLPLLGVLKVKGLASTELEKEIGDLLAEKFLHDPHVSVFIKEYRSQRISVIGTVEKPGVFEITGQKTVLDMLGLAGGLKDEAGPLLFLIRPPLNEEEMTPEKGESNSSLESAPRTYVIDLEELLVKGDMQMNLSVVHGDVINVPISGKIFVGGEVTKPGGYPLKGKKVTLSQAVALAEGVRPQANGAETKIFRYRGKGTEKEVLTVNVYAVQDGRAEDIYLQENDIVFVPKSGVKNFLIGLRDTVRGLFGIGFTRGF